jgi:3-mercaptopyruvate sulfurtransferase SseA
MSRFEREVDEDERREAIEQRRAQRRANSCWCGLDGFPGHCPGAANCPYSGFHDKEEEDEE